MKVPYDQPLDLSCQLEEPKENVNYSWTIHTEFEHDYLINSRATLHRDRGQFLGGIYTCRAENQCGHDIADFAVKLSGKLQLISLLRVTIAIAIYTVSSPGPFPAFQYCMMKSGRAWYVKSCA